MKKSSIDNPAVPDLEKSPHPPANTKVEVEHNDLAFRPLYPVGSIVATPIPEPANAPQNSLRIREEGWRGVKVVMGCVVFAIATMGFTMSAGALQAYYAAGPYASTQESVISLITGVQILAGTVLAQLGGKAGDTIGFRPVLMASATFCFISIIGAALSTKIWQLFITQGLMYGVASAGAVPLVLSLPSQWFFKHRGLATGIVGGCAGLGGAINSIAIRLMLVRFNGSRNTLLCLAGIYSALWILGLCLIEENRDTPDLMAILRYKWYSFRGKQDVEEEEGAAAKPRTIKRKGSLGPLLKDHVFWAFVLGIVFSCFAYVCPFSYLPTYTRQVIIPNMPPSSVTSLTPIWPLFTANMGMFVGRVAAGMAADKVGATQTMVTCYLIAGILQMLVWHFVKTFPGIIAWAFFTGSVGGAAMSLSALVIAQIWGVNDNFASAVGITIIANGPGSFAGPFMAGATLDATNSWLAFTLVAGAGQVIGAVIGLWTLSRGVGWRLGNNSLRR